MDISLASRGSSIDWLDEDRSSAIKLTQRGSTIPSACATALSLPQIHHPLRNDGRRKPRSQAATMAGNAVIFLFRSVLVGFGKIAFLMCLIRSVYQSMTSPGHACIRQSHQLSHHTLYKRPTLLMPGLTPNCLDQRIRRALGRLQKVVTSLSQCFSICDPAAQTRNMGGTAMVRSLHSRSSVKSDSQCKVARLYHGTRRGSFSCVCSVPVSLKTRARRSGCPCPLLL